MTNVESVFAKHHLNSHITPISLRFGLCSIITIKMALFVTEPSVCLLWWEAALEYSVLIFDWPAVTNQGEKKEPCFSSFHQNHIPRPPPPPLFLSKLHPYNSSFTLAPSPFVQYPGESFSPSHVLFLVAENSFWMFVSVDMAPLTNNSENLSYNRPSDASVPVRCTLTTRVGTLILATIYLQLIQNRYMFRSFTLLQCSHQHCLQPVASDVEVVG